MEYSANTQPVLSISDVMFIYSIYIYRERESNINIYMPHSTAGYEAE